MNLLLEVMMMDSLKAMTTPALWAYVAETWHRVNRCGQAPPHGDMVYSLAMLELRKRVVPSCHGCGCRTAVHRDMGAWVCEWCECEVKS